MVRRRWDDPWTSYPESRPLPVDGGLKVRSKRGVIAGSWWSRRFVDVLESYGLGARMQRGRRYARSGQVMSLDVSPGLIAAQVQGSRRTPYLVTVRSAEPSATQWRKLDDAFVTRVSFAARLLAGEVPIELEEVFAEAGVALFPRTWSDVRASCNCPDWENPCKHIAAVLYVFAERLDTDPWALLEWRGRTRDDLLGPLRARATPAAEQVIAPWWPLVPSGSGDAPDPRVDPSVMGPDGVLSVVVEPLDLLDPPDPPDPPHRVVVRMEPLEAEVAGTPLTELLAGVYASIVDRRGVDDRIDAPGHHQGRGDDRVDDEWT